MSQSLWVATRKGLFRFHRVKTGEWVMGEVSFLGDPVSMLLEDPEDGTVYAALSHGHFGVKMQRSEDGGTTWTECAVPSYEGIPADPLSDNPYKPAPKPPSLKLISSLEAGGGGEPGTLWAGTIPGGLFRSTDRGNSWELVRPLWDLPERQQWFGGGWDETAIHSVCVDPRDSRRVTLGISCGGVWMTPDGGETWESRARGMWAAYMPPDQKDNPNVQDPHRVVQCSDQPDCLWAQHHNGVFRTTDGGASWQEVTDIRPSGFGFAVAVHPRDPQTAWLVPAIKDERRVPVDGRLVVTRTRDGGRTFDILNDGLPREPAYDLVYRHGLDVDGTGQCLAFGSTTGGLWISENGGDSWTCAPARLPPVYAVRWTSR